MNQFIKILRVTGVIAFVLYLITKFLTDFTLLMSIAGITAAICFSSLIVTFIYNLLNQHYIK